MTPEYSFNCCLDPDHPLALYNTIEMTMLTVHLNDTVVFPCRPTDPELQVELRKEDPDPVVITHLAT